MSKPREEHIYYWSQIVIFIVFIIISGANTWNIWVEDHSQYEEEIANASFSYNLMKRSIIILLITLAIIVFLSLIYNHYACSYHINVFDYIKRQVISIGSYGILLSSLLIAIMGGLIALNPFHILRREDLYYFSFLVKAFPYLLFTAHIITIRIPRLNEIR